MENSASAVTFTFPLGELHISHPLSCFVHDQRQVGDIPLPSNSY